VLTTTHSQTLIAAVHDPSAVLLLEPSRNGTIVRSANADEKYAMENGLNPAEVLLPKTRPQKIELMGLSK
jgi:hypothetical protein